MTDEPYVMSEKREKEIAAMIVNNHDGFLIELRPGVAGGDAANAIYDLLSEKWDARRVAALPEDVSGGTGRV